MFYRSKVDVRMIYALDCKWVLCTLMFCSWVLDFYLVSNYFIASSFFYKSGGLSN